MSFETALKHRKKHKVTNLKKLKRFVEVPGIEPGTFRMRSGHSTTELHPHRNRSRTKCKDFNL